MMKNGVYFILIAFFVAELFKILIMQIRGLVTSQDGHKMMKNKIWNICANAKSIGLKFCRVDVLHELHSVIVAMMSP